MIAKNALLADSFYHYVYRRLRYASVSDAVIVPLKYTSIKVTSKTHLKYFKISIVYLTEQNLAQ